MTDAFQVDAGIEAAARVCDGRARTLTGEAKWEAMNCAFAIRGYSGQRRLAEVREERSAATKPEVGLRERVAEIVHTARLAPGGAMTQWTTALHFADRILALTTPSGGPAPWKVECCDAAGAIVWPGPLEYLDLDCTYCGATVENGRLRVSRLGAEGGWPRGADQMKRRAAMIDAHYLTPKQERDVTRGVLDLSKKEES